MASCKLVYARKLVEAIEDEHVSLVAALLEDGANPNLILPSEGVSPFHLAVGAESRHALRMTTLLLEHQGNPNIRSAEGLTPVHVAASWGRFQALELLLRSGGDPSLTDEDDNTAADMAKTSDHWDCIDLLETWQQDRDGESEEEPAYLFLTPDRCMGQPDAGLVDDDDAAAAPGGDIIPSTWQSSSDEDILNRTLDSLSIDLLNSTCLSVDSPGQSNSYTERHDSISFSQNSTSRPSSPGARNRIDRAPSDPHDDEFQHHLDCVITNHESCSQCETEDTAENNVCESPHYEVVTGSLGIDVTSPDCVVYFSKAKAKDKRRTIACHLQYPRPADAELQICDGEDNSDSSEVSSGRGSMCSHPVPPLEQDEVMLRGEDNDLMGSCEDNDLMPSSEDNDLMGSGEDNDLMCRGEDNDLMCSGEHNDLICCNVSTEHTNVHCPLSSETQASFHAPDVSVLSSSSSYHTAGSPDSSVLCNGAIKALYRDEEKGASLVEQHFPSASGSEPSPLDFSLVSENTVLYDWTSFLTDAEDADTVRELEIPPELAKLSNADLMSKLKELGDDVGPVTATTRSVYLNFLARRIRDHGNLVMEPANRKQNPSNINFRYELAATVNGTRPLPEANDLENQMVSQFQEPDPQRKWREGKLKFSFNYLLLDPRVSRDLPSRYPKLTRLETFKTFVSAIFYVGKGKRSRPYAHFEEAVHSTQKEQTKKPSCKVHHILDIWSGGMGVISLHCFQNVIPVEAYTREACMIDALGLSRLTNVKRGDYYGVAHTWSGSKKRQIGVHLLYKACQIFLMEGERQIRNVDIISGQ